MSASEVLLDTCAWWEILHGTSAGHALARRHLARGRRPHASALSLGEIAAKLASLAAPPARIEEALAALRVHGQIHPVTADLAAHGGHLRQALRNRDPGASLADGIILATARSLDVPLVSDDAAFRGEKDVQPFEARQQR